MKSLKIFSIVFVCCAIATTSFAQKTKTETFQVSGNCGMCESKIEKAAKEAGATYAEWNKDQRLLLLSTILLHPILPKFRKALLM